ncbi:uncharacterized protein LOC110626461 [Manihot esculenta]|uniref:uncharacterized protein LOC110626461 n=1 Tax=Manihot esculenta TaxID=3983 RepID=UPI000B5D8FFE|nr:uncharacterized protein LOC110626461 [Manihot esculenta]
MELQPWQQNKLQVFLNILREAFKGQKELLEKIEQRLENVDKSHQECSNLKMMSHLDEGQEEVDAVCDGVEGQVDTIGDGEEVVPYQSDSNGNEDMAAEVQDNICVEVHQATTLMHLGSLEKFKDQSGAEMGQGFIVDMFGVSEVIRRLMKMVMTGN